MPDPNTEHGLRVQLATALRERDTEKARAEKAEAELARMRADFGHEQAMHFRAETAADKLIKEKEVALAAARRECEGLREFARSVAEYDEYRGDDEDEDPPLEILARIEAKARAALGDSE